MRAGKGHRRFRDQEQQRRLFRVRRDPDKRWRRRFRSRRPMRWCWAGLGAMGFVARRRRKAAAW